MAAFAAEVRAVFHKCYHTFGMPEAAYVSKCCEKLDLIFEQRSTCCRAAAGAGGVQPQHGGGEAEGEEAGEERRARRARA